MLKKISIITPSFNQGEFIEDAILSVLNQKNIIVEHIIIDGGSTDNTIRILKKYNHLKWVSEKDNGQTNALNKALKLVTGDIIGWLNADDYYQKNIFEKVIKELNSKEVNFVYGNFNYVSKSKKILKRIIAKKKFFISKKIISKFICFIPSVTFFIKKENLKNITFDENVKLTMDKELFANLYHRNFLSKKINYTISNFRLHENNKLEMKKDHISKFARYYEGVYIYNKYSKHKISQNIFGRLFYSNIQKILILLNFISNFLNK